MGIGGIHDLIGPCTGVGDGVLKQCRAHSGNELLHVTSDSHQTDDAGCMDDGDGDDKTLAVVAKPK
ncbi:hypothetical protein E2562_009584 [Oryza meyeriana var. granulata]|uniref:Uncharacterized protein n=1 Tax=Oryza meyeriana var. granulata TaxID=110450 RepID=A0A6G1F659_9ORYZ|nr:hypothetical protein E2562_009584 [Oryza meyeriana var. granulata]